jgi:hypothetical protein
MSKPKIKPISEACMNELIEALDLPGCRLSPCAYERHRNALKSRGFIDSRSVITDSGREFVKISQGKEP